LLAKHGAPVDLVDLARLPAIGQGTLESVRPWTFKAPDGSAMVHHPEPRLVIENIIALREAAIHGAGVIQLPWDACKTALERGELCPVLEQYLSIGVSVYCVYPTRSGMPAAVRVLLSFLEERFRTVY
jgi:DNA-binding transcriptional LysR family regulator